MVKEMELELEHELHFQYSLCRVVLMVAGCSLYAIGKRQLSVLALSSRFDGLSSSCVLLLSIALSVLALSSRFDGHGSVRIALSNFQSFSTRSVESF